jgi:hypothetical protein
MRYRRALIHGLQLKTSTVGKPISSTRPASRRPSSRVIVDQNGPPGTYDLAVISTTTSASPSSWAIHPVHISPSDIDFPRAAISDTDEPQLYTLNNDQPAYGMVLVKYTREEPSNALHGCTAITPSRRSLDMAAPANGEVRCVSWEHDEIAVAERIKKPQHDVDACWLDVYGRTSAVGRLQDRLAVWTEVDGPALLERFCERLSDIGRLQSISCGRWHG